MIFTKTKLSKVIEAAIEKAIGGEGKVKDLKTQIGKLELDKATLKEDLADLQTTKKQELRDIEHLVKIKEEKLNIEHQKALLKSKTEFKDKEMALQTDYFNKSLSQLNEHSEKIQAMYAQILTRLPDINAVLQVKRK